jgi:hypothetical protein
VIVLSLPALEPHMTTTADELKAAAGTLRTLLTAIHAPDLADQSWHIEECADDEQGNCPCIVAQGQFADGVGPITPLYYVADAETPECAAYIAAMGPNVGTLLADWLEFHAAMNERLHGLIDGLPDGDDHPALALARAIAAVSSAP